MAGLIGASNSPVSGIGILAVVSCASMLVVFFPPTPETRTALVAFALVVTSIIMACATISNDNLQDLKTGQLVGASPMRQQIALIVGVVAGSAVISPVLNLLTRLRLRRCGERRRGHPEPAAVPQATLISALAQGVVGGSLNWTMIGIGALVGAGLILLDAALRMAGKLRVPPLAVGIGIYLPMVGHLHRRARGDCARGGMQGPARRSKDYARADRLGTLVASGLIVGESLFGVLNAALIVSFNSDAPLALVPEDFAPARILALLGFVGSVAWLYWWLVQKRGG